jgi:hypothetical protein
MLSIRDIINLKSLIYFPTAIDEYLEYLPKKRQPKCAIEYFENTTSVPDPSDINPMKNLFIFDDIATEKNRNLADSFTPVEDIMTVVQFTYPKTITYYQDKPFERIQIY